MEVVNEEKSRRKVFTRLESKQQVDNIAMTRRYLMEWKEAVRDGHDDDHSAGHDRVARDGTGATEQKRTVEEKVFEGPDVDHKSLSDRVEGVGPRREEPEE
eukprot:629816-Rhodomonas_salina.1